MTGTLDNKAMRVAWIGSLALALSLPIAIADEVSLNDGLSKISGDLRAILPTGTIEMLTTASATPLLIKGGSAQKVILSNTQKTETLPPALVQLINGDMIRGTVEEMNQQEMVLSTEEAGTIKIGRQFITSAQFGLRRTNLIYNGPNNLAMWKQSKSTRDRWLYRKGALVTTGRSSASQDLKLPSKFSLVFKLKWKSERPPQYEIFFADPDGDAKKRPDRYSFAFSNYGIEIRRYTAKDKKRLVIAQLSRDPKLYANNEMLVEIRLNRETAQLQLLINGEPEGDFIDPIENIPEGTHLRIVSESMRGSQLEISNIKVTEFNGGELRHSSEGHGDKTTDSLILLDDERWSGKLVSIKKSADGAMFHFESPAREGFLEVPSSEVSMIYLSQPAADKLDPAQPEIFHDAASHLVNLVNDWGIKATSCKMDHQILTANHPLIGPLQIQRPHVASIVLINTPKKSNTKGKP